MQIFFETLRLAIPAMTGSIFPIGGSQAIQRTPRIDMSASDEDRADGGHRSHVGIQEGGTDDRRDQMGIAVTGNRRRLTVRDAEGRHALLSGPQHRIDGVSEALAETDGYQCIF